MLEGSGVTEMAWNGWGDPARAEPLSEAVTGLVREVLGVAAAPPPAVRLEEVVPPPSRLTGEVVAALADIVGAEHVDSGARARIGHTRGKSTLDLLAIRVGDVSDAPDAVVRPGSHDEICAVLARCADHRVAVVPFGGGTSVVGGLAPARAAFDSVIALDLGRLDRLLAVDAVSRTATLEPGLRGPAAEALLAGHGFSLGHFPQSFEWATIGGFAAARSSGQASAGYGRFDDMVVGLTVATPTGTLDLGRAPKSAAGPDLRQLVLGSEGAFGVITSVTVRVVPVPEVRRYEGWRFASFEVGTAALRRLAQDGPLPAVLRLSDETETMIGLGSPSNLVSNDSVGCEAIIGFEGLPDSVSDRQAKVRAILDRAGGSPLGTDKGESWEHGRYQGPYLRDALLEVGAIVETVETATFWSNLPRLYEAVRKAVSESLETSLVLCHISHVYPAGASLYFTIAAAQGEDPVGRWRRAKAGISDAIIEAGGTISHHHGVGVDHRAAYAREIGPVGVRIMRAIKDELDPAGILNPGVLIPQD
jgi:alkyldihydroxyacetonephosphate synthase